MSLNARKKGHNGEREFCKWLSQTFTLPTDAKRNLEQVRVGRSGGDINIGPFSFEVKRRESLDLQTWWIQAKHDAASVGLEPVVAFRQNRQPWEFLISASHIGCSLGFLRVSEQVFVNWCEGVWENGE